MEQANLEKVHLFVSGQVQGVGFRYSTQRQAMILNLTGWVRNCPDWRVEIWAEGEKEALTSFLNWCGQGPTQAIVESVETVERNAIPSRDFAKFEIRK
jgi:acylphosphatase